MLETDRDLRRMRRALEDFEADFQGSEVALIFYVGHGVELSGQNLILPIDADPTSLEKLRQSALPLEELRDVAVRMAPVAIILVDACREDPFGIAPGTEGRGGVRLAPAATRSINPGMGRMGDARNTLFAFSTAPGALAADGTANSPFTLALAKYLATPGVEVRSALTLVQQEVYDSTGGGQLPYIENGLPQLYFIGLPASGELSERERLLLAMAGFDEEARAEIEEVAAAYQVPLATLYGAALGSGLEGAALDQLRAGLIEAAVGYRDLAQLMRSFSASDPEVQALREAAEAQLRPGAFDEALALVREAQALDRAALLDVDRVRLERTLSSAVSAQLEAQIARTGLDHTGAISALETAQRLYDTIETEIIDDEHALNRGKILFDLATLRLNIGKSAEALVALEALLRSTELWQAQGSKDDRLWQQRGRAYMALGHIHTERFELEPALVALAQSSQIVTALLEIYPGEPTLLFDLVNILMMQGDLEIRQARPTAALRRFTEAVDVAEVELARDPADSGLRELVSKALGRLGDAQWGVQDLVAAALSYRRAEQIARDEARLAPADPTRRRTLMVAVMKLATLLREERRPKALAYFLEATELSAKGLNDDPQNMLRLSDRHAALAEYAATLVLYGQASESLPYLREALSLGQRLARLDPEKTEWQRALALTHFSLAEAGDPALSHLLAGRALLVGLEQAGKLGANEKALLQLFDNALRELERGNWPPKSGASVAKPADAGAEPTPEISPRKPWLNRADAVEAEPAVNDAPAGDAGERRRRR